MDHQSASTLLPERRGTKKRPRRELSSSESQWITSTFLSRAKSRSHRSRPALQLPVRCSALLSRVRPSVLGSAAAPEQPRHGSSFGPRCLGSLLFQARLQGAAPRPGAGGSWSVEMGDGLLWLRGVVKKQNHVKINTNLLVTALFGCFLGCEALSSAQGARAVF